MVRPFFHRGKDARLGGPDAPEHEPSPTDPLVLEQGAPVILPPDGLWRVDEGEIEVYLTWPSGRRLLGVRHKGDMLFGLNQGADTKLLLLPLTPGVLVATAEAVEDIATAADQWLQDAGRTLEKPKSDAKLDVAQHDIMHVEDGDHLIANGDIRWALSNSEVTLSLCGHDNSETTLGLLPVGAGYWGRVTGGGDVRLKRTHELGPIWIRRAVADTTNRLASIYTSMDNQRDQRDLDRLASRQNDQNTQAHSAADAVRQIARALGVAAREPGFNSSDLSTNVRTVGLRARKVALRDGWHRNEQGALLVTPRDGSAPVALLWDPAGYRTAAGEKITQQLEARYTKTALAVSPPLPHTVDGLWSLARFVMFSGNRRDAVLAGIAASFLALLGLLLPLGTSWLLADIVPSGAAGLLISVGIALAVASVIAMALSTARGIAIRRIDGRGASLLNSALTDRLLRLPTSFFTTFSAGDLNQRLENVEQMRSLGVSILLSAGLTAVLSIVYLLVLFVYDTRLALIAIGLISLYIVAVVLARVLQMEAIREAASLDGEIAGLTFETLEGVGKLRAAAAEERAMQRWLGLYSKERGAAIRAGRVATHFAAFADAYQTITLLVLFAGAGALSAIDAPAGVFIGFLAAFGSLQGAFVGLSEALLQVYTAQPLIERARPVLRAKTEVDPTRNDPGPLSGRIEASGLSFAYGERMPPVLSDLDFRIEPGQHMAVVGGSGSGKSTLLRLLLGFESPQRGAILYDGQDLSRLDLTQVRSQIGVVLQASKLFAGSILENVRGAGTASLEDCLAAIEKAGLTRDMEYFAMGVHTPVTEGANTLSGGQRQRILIARALAANPRILFFDEATSALDNTTQAVVSQTLDAMKMARITIAHRLSTVRNADMICVLDKGRFVERGTYDELIERNKVFARLAERQLIGD